jgi:hypothetical protein
MSHSRNKKGARARVVYLSDLERARARQPRYYCPSCGMVRAERDSGTPQVVTKASPARVLGHEMNGLGLFLVGLAREHCPGGEIDLVKDRAP